MLLANPTEKRSSGLPVGLQRVGMEECHNKYYVKARNVRPGVGKKPTRSRSWGRGQGRGRGRGVFFFHFLFIVFVNLVCFNFFVLCLIALIFLRNQDRKNHET